MGPIIGKVKKPNDLPRTMDSTEKYVFVLDDSMERAIRFDKKTGEQTVLNEGMSEDSICYSLRCI